jgi:Amt family ammonium transporter
MHPVGALVVGGVAGFIFVEMFQIATNDWKLDDVLGVWPLHGLCGLWGGVAAGIFGLKALGGLGGVSLVGQIFGSLLGAGAGFASGLVVYTVVDVLLAFRLSPEEERIGADLAIHKIGANPEQEVRTGPL